MLRLFNVVLTLVLVFIVANAQAAQVVYGHNGSELAEIDDYFDDEDSGWSWESGLIGDSGSDDDVFSDEDFYPGWLCNLCRDPQQYPIDFSAMAYNAYFGDSAWAMESILGIPFRVYNLELDWVAVWFENFLFDAPSLLPDTMTVVIRLRTGEILRFEVLQGGPDMPVGDPNTETNGGGNGGGNDGSDDDDYGENDDQDFEEPEIDEPTGVVEIEDPDEDGEFPDWEEEL